MISRYRMLLFALCCVSLSSCGSKWETVELQSGTALMDLLSIDLYAPFDRSTLLYDADGAYGKPHDFGSKSKGKDYVLFKEYVGKHGRIRIYDEAYESEQGWESAQWLELYPGKLYLRDVVKKQYLADVTIAEGEWKLSLMPTDRSWYLTLELDGEAITKIVDLTR